VLTKTAATITIGGIALLGVGFVNASTSASADIICFNNLVGPVQSPDGTAKFQIVSDGTGVSFQLTGARSAVSMVLHLADGTSKSIKWPAGIKSYDDFHAEPRQKVNTYDVCKDESAAVTTTTTSTTAAPTTTTTVAPTTTAPATTTTTEAPEVEATTTTTAAPIVTTTTMMKPQVEPTVFTNPAPALPATGQDLRGIEMAAGGSLALGGAMLFAARRRPTRS
jgi:LPXTG-motif cell wall-anchored protein